MIVDFGVDALVKLAQKTHFPWLLSNVLNVMTEQPLAEAATSHVLNWQGRKVSIAICTCTISNISTSCSTTTRSTVKVVYC